MPTYRDTAVVLRVGKIGEADRVVTLLTRREGRVRAVAKGVRRTKSRFGARLEPFSHVDVQLYAGRSLDVVTQAVTLDPFGSTLAADYPRYTAGTAIVETVERLTGEERQPALRLYLLLVSALRALVETPRDPSLVLDAFLLRAMTLAGWSPALAECARCGDPGPHAAFHVPSGGLLCALCRPAGAARPAPAAIDLMQFLTTGDWAGAEALPGSARREASGLVAALLQWHLERGLRSLALVDRTGGATAGPPPSSGRRPPMSPTGGGTPTAPALAPTLAAPTLTPTLAAPTLASPPRTPPTMTASALALELRLDPEPVLAVPVPPVPGSQAPVADAPAPDDVVDRVATGSPAGGTG